MKLHDAEAIEQIAAETARRHLGAQIAVGRGDHPDVDPLGLERADPLHLAVFDRPQQFRLDAQRQFADLVEKQRAAVGMLEHADLGFRRPGERAALVAEQFALEQGVDDGRAVDGHEAAVTPRPHVMEATRHQFLAGAGLARHQHRPHVRREPADRVEQLLHRRAAADHAVELELPRHVGVVVEQASRAARSP